MEKSKEIRQRITAALLLAALLFIYAVKAFHHHAPPAAMHGPATQYGHYAGGHCSICDFHISSPATVPLQSSLLLLLFLAAVIQTPQLCAGFRSFSRAELFRGPPRI